MYNSSMHYIEDVLLELGSNHLDKVSVPTQDHLILSSFYNIQTRGDNLTKSQGQLLLKILEKYKVIFQLSGLDYADMIKTPEWKSKFRSLDLTKRVYVEKDTDGKNWIYLKFPYQLKDKFEKFSKDELNITGVWDPEKRSRKLILYNCNLIALNDFIIENSFEIDETFIEAMAAYEEILSQQENIVPASAIINGQVRLINASEEIQQWFQENSTGSVFDDLFLAKSMGYFLSKVPENVVEKIAAEHSTNFWMQSPRQFLIMTKDLSGKVALILDRAHNNYNWLKEFVSTARDVGFTSSDIKICFRNDKDKGLEFNEWIRENGFGGKVEDGKILIFNHKPAKWVFKNPREIKIVCTNNVYPSTDSITKDWFSNHPCVIHLGDIKPSKNKDKQIVNL